MNDPVIKYCIIYLYYHPIYYLISCCSIPSLYLPVSLYLTLSLSHTLTLSLTLSLSTSLSLSLSYPSLSISLLLDAGHTCGIADLTLTSSAEAQRKKLLEKVKTDTQYGLDAFLSNTSVIEGKNQTVLVSERDIF